MANYTRGEDISILDVLRVNGCEVPPMKKGTGIAQCKCMLHDDDSPSFTIYGNTNSFYCFGCRKAGSAVDLHRFINNYPTNKEALADLERKFEIDYDAVPTVEVFAGMKGLSVELLQELGWEDTSAGIKIPYQGMLPEEIIEGGVTYRIRRAYTSKAKKSKYIKDGTGVNQPYLLNMLGTYDTEKPLYIAEGETDAITLLQAGYQVLGVPGATVWNNSFARYLDPYPMIIVAADNDEPGLGLVRLIKNALEPRKSVLRSS